MVECPLIEKKENFCPCPDIGAKVHGPCCECVSYHRTRNKHPPCLKFTVTLSSALE